MDVSRAEEAKKRAKAKIEEAKQSDNHDIDLARAQVALTRAINRLNVANKKR
ncbi:MAG: ATP synthase delta/epsilon chain alpha-helix domain-containing protein [Vagococcus fluvialis]